LLDGSAVFLTLPAHEWAAVIFKGEFPTLHGRKLHGAAAASR
jgi:hypothetical protein